MNFINFVLLVAISVFTQVLHADTPECLVHSKEQMDFIKAPCDLNGPDVERTIKIYGEEHTNFYDQEVKSLMATQVHQGHLLVMVEGLGYNKSSTFNRSDVFEASGARGLEDSGPYTLEALLQSYMHFYDVAHGTVTDSLRISGYKNTFLMAFFDEPMQMTAFKKVAPKLKTDPNSAALTTFLEGLFACRDAKKCDFLTQFMEVEKKSVWSDNRAFLHLAREVAEEAGRNFQETEKTQYRFINLKPYFDTLENPTPELRVATLGYYAGGVRNLVFARNILRYVCSTKGQLKDMWIQVGAAHVEDLACLLKTQIRPEQIHVEKSQPYRDGVKNWVSNFQKTESFQAAFKILVETIGKNDSENFVISDVGDSMRGFQTRLNISYKGSKHQLSQATYDRLIERMRAVLPPEIELQVEDSFVLLTPPFGLTY